MLLNRYDLFAETVFHLECIVQHDVHSKVLKYVEENFKRSPNSVSNIGGFRSQDDFDGKQELIKIIENNFNSDLKKQLRDVTTETINTAQNNSLSDDLTLVAIGK